MSFEVPAEAYDRFMGRFSAPLAREFVALSAPRDGEHVVDVGCGPGALTTELVAQRRAASVAAVDPSAPFVAAVRDRCPGVDVRLARAEALPFDDAAFDLALAQLVVHFMTDPVAGLVEMSRVTRPGGRVAACVWDHGGGRGPLSLFWEAVGDVEGEARDESGLAGAREGHLVELFALGGLQDVQSAVLTVRVEMASFDEWWQPFTLGVGPAGDHVARLDVHQRDTLRARCAELLPGAPLSVTASAWAAVGTVATHGVGRAPTAGARRTA